MTTSRPSSRLLKWLVFGLAASAVVACNRHVPKPSPSSAPVAVVPPSDPSKPPSEPKIAIRSMDRRVPVIMYHDVIAQRTADSVYFDTTTAEFEAQMSDIEARGFQPISLDQLYAHLTQGAQIPPKSIVLSFDDNYEGVYQNALPILKLHHFPAVEFVHTNFVGSQAGEGHMSWDQLKELLASGLFTIGSHTESHPANITRLSYGDQQREIEGSKATLEQHLGIKIDYFAYPDGKNDSVTQGLVKGAGYKMAFATTSGLAEESPNLYTIHRYEHLKLDKAMQAAEDAMTNGPAAVLEQDLTQTPVTLTVGEFEGLKIAVVKGGSPESVMSNTRETVPDLVSENDGVAGINGSFFAMAAIAATSNEMIGPCYVPANKVFLPETSAERLPKLRNRPIVMWDANKIAIFNFQPESFNTEEPYRDFMPDFTDLFLAGAWIVHNGIAVTEDQLNAYATRDFRDVRRRAFFGWTAAGVPIVGASLQTCSSERMGEAAAAAGAQEAVLLDSGFSTSLVFNGRIVVTGHTAPGLPSRPVPHAIVLKGTLDLNGADAMLASAAEGAKAPADIEGERRARIRRAERLLASRRKAEHPTPDPTAATSPSESTPTPDETPPATKPPVAPPPDSKPPDTKPPDTKPGTTGGSPPE
ncbi:MAG: polysaccharide deacetylase family protein [Fimbriimonadaceae bacterium]